MEGERKCDQQRRRFPPHSSMAGGALGHFVKDSIDNSRKVIEREETRLPWRESHTTIGPYGPEEPKAHPVVT